MMDRNRLDGELSQLPLYVYEYIDPRQLEYSQRIRWICSNECPMYGKTWACPPGVGTVEHCAKKCLSYKNCLMISTITEISSIANIEEAPVTRAPHDAAPNRVRALLRLSGWTALPVSGENAPLLGKPRDQCDPHAGKARAGLPVR